MLEIKELLVNEKSLRVSEIAAKLSKPYKIIERYIKILKDIKAIDYKG